ncbi:hypothetical protein SAMN05444007_108257 [Cribrihabitans marinus]|uniref:Uncharacterized protein n=1 Tax=Cribrihabitans marinus TaxID=1227549 RepID=A0A1H7CQA9_9RHOB|nr:hypothetical protein [Cribrihabitans marinus]GGH36389.1 hypothetical protein GCM10010973_30280 [Cribrihabitans marinus]SEJ91771.1 hypothetical protein SAMN05444007_108257 [Cribrihabitans marinus]
MANLHDCLQRAVDAGELDQIRADEAKSEFDQLVERYGQAMPFHQAEATAALHLKEATQKARRSRRHAVLNQLQSMVRLRHMVQTADDPALALRSMIERIEGGGFKGESVQSLSEAYIRSVNAGLNDVLPEVRRNLIGNNRKPALLRDIVRELHGDASGSEMAAALAEKVRHQQKRMRQMFNAHGGDIGEIDDYGLAHSHDAVRLRKAGFEAWAEKAAPLLDWHRMIDKRSDQPFAAAPGQRPDPVREREHLAQLYENIVTEGWNTREPSMAMGGKALYNRRADPRHMHFRNGSAWMEYNEAFGRSDPFTAMIGQLHGMARDVAMMRVLGPNPKLGLEYATQVAKKRAISAQDFDLGGRVDKAGKLAQTMLGHIDGSANEVYSEGWARFFSSTRQVLTSIQLGSAALSAVTDLQTMRVASSAMGLNPNNVMARQVQLLASSATRETARRMGYVADTLAQAGSAAARYTGEIVSGEFAERLTGFTMRASGLAHWTDVNRIAFQMEFAGYMAENAARGFDQIEPPLRRLFEERGITARDWDLLRAPDTLFNTDTGADFLSPFHWLEHQSSLPRAEAEGLAMRLQMAIEEQMEFAVPSATVEGRARMIGSSEAGTFFGELLRSTAMYKSFSVSLTLNQYRRFMALPSPMSRAVYAARMITGLTILGGVAVQLKELSKGNDPRPMDNMKFWAAAGFQGGGLGIFGDFFASETSRAGGGLAETLAGPVAGLAGDIIRPISSNVVRAAEGKDLLLGRDAANFIRYNTPVASSLWYGRVAFDRIVADQVQSFLDPEADAVWRRQMRRREREYGTRTFWPRGEPVPERGPDISNALGGSR